MGVKDISKLMKLKAQMEKVQNHGERIFTKIDEEMYLISKSEKNEIKKGEAQKQLAVFIIAELLESFEKKEIEEILSMFDKVFED